MSIADLHADLLWYLAKDSGRTPFDAASQISLTQLTAGGVKLQIFPIYTKTGHDSVQEGEKQWTIYNHAFPFFATHLTPRLSIENSSSFCSEDEPLEVGLKRLARWHAAYPLVYISLTWNEENRFGGGAATSIGLKDDGKKLLEWMQGKKIAVDLSHASDALAEAVLKETVTLVPIASHSNFRSVHSHERNLPDHLAQEICRKGGIIGLNLIRHFVGSQVQDFLRHLEHAHRLGIENHLCLGADFFPEIDVEKEKAHLKPYFFEGFSNPECFPKLCEMLRGNFSEAFIENLLSKRLMQFLAE